jgi:uncharacterized protein
VAKTERFEMRLDEDVLARVDRWRAEQTDLPSRAEAMRRLVETGLSRLSSANVRFSDGEKLLAMMMRDLYKHLKVTSAEIDPDLVGEILWGGHYWAFPWVFQGLFHGHADNPATLTYVVDVLDMWSFLEQGFEQLSDKDKALVHREAEPFGKHVKFPGFDGNNEGEHLGVAMFLIEKLDRFTSFKDRDLNSHFPTEDTYRRMLTVFEPIRAQTMGRELNAGELIKVLKAKARPKSTVE